MTQKIKVPCYNGCKSTRTGKPKMVNTTANFYGGRDSSETLLMVRCQGCYKCGWNRGVVRTAKVR